MNVMKNRKIFYIISLSLILAGVVMFLINGFNYGIDFTGGTLLEINVGKFIPVDEVREIVEEYDPNMSILHGGNNKESLIIKSTLNLSSETINNILNEFVVKYDIDNKNFQSNTFGPIMGKEIRERAILSIIISTIAMLIYITFRFEFRFGLAAIVALLHDVLITVAVYAIFKLPVNAAFIAAILTVVGYSINDTIVIFDRIREELRLNPRHELDEIIDDSISKSLRRTINTTITTLVAVIVLYIVGVEDIKVLALPLIVGMISGTYSSIFIASPLWFEFKKIKWI